MTAISSLSSSPLIQIDLVSDTITRPSKEMRQCMAMAEVGDEQYGEDPTVNALQEKVAQLLGKEAALFLPSGTMCNEIAIRLHCEPGDEIIGDETCHVNNFETAGAAALSGCSFRALNGLHGIYSVEQLKRAIRPISNHAPRSRLIVVEQSSNLGGGSVWPLEHIRKICAVARENKLACHIDGARLFNAVVASGISAKDYCATFDSAWIDFSKGLGAPVGAALAGSKDFIRRAWRFKTQFGGAMRQAGIIAAGGLYALEHNIERLKIDHENARLFLQGLRSISALEFYPLETNIIIFSVAGLGLNAKDFCAKVRERGVRLAPIGDSLVRAVTHLDLSRNDIEKATQIISQIFAE